MLASARRRSVKCLFVRLDTTNNVTMEKIKHFSARNKSYKKYRNYFEKTLDIKALVW